MFGLKKRKNKEKSNERTHDGKTLNEMSKPEKGDFLSMDLTERMIRVEQRVSASFNKSVSYDQTDYYKSLKPDEKKRFEVYLKKNNRRKLLLSLLFLVPLLALFSLRIEFTGNVIKEAIDVPLLGILENISALLILVMGCMFLIMVITKRIRNKKYEEHFEVLEDIFLEKGLTKKRYHQANVFK